LGRDSGEKGRHGLYPSMLNAEILNVENIQFSEQYSMEHQPRWWDNSLVQHWKLTDNIPPILTEK
jgi:hypothetical protein